MFERLRYRAVLNPILLELVQGHQTGDHRNTNCYYADHNLEEIRIVGDLTYQKRDAHCKQNLKYAETPKPLLVPLDLLVVPGNLIIEPVSNVLFR